MRKKMTGRFISGFFLLIEVTVFLALMPAANAFVQEPKQSSLNLVGEPFQQIAITTTNLPRAIDFYRDTLGLPMFFETNGMAFFDVGGVRLMVSLDPEREESRTQTILYFNTPDLMGSVERLRLLDIQLDGPVETVQRTPDGSLMLQQFRDPDGNALAVMGTVRITTAND